MKKKVIACIVILIILTSGCIYSYVADYIDNRASQDALKFKEEYESLNGKENTSGQKYPEISISSENNIKYVDISEALDIIKNKTGIIYFGANWCPWCRNAIPVLLNAATSTNTKNIYYLDMSEVRNTWDVIDDKVVKTKEEKKGYYDLINALANILGDNYTLRKDGKEYDVGEKRIMLPTFIAVKDGKIVAYHIGTINLKEGQTAYSSLDDDQIEELNNLFTDMMEKVKTKKK